MTKQNKKSAGSKQKKKKASLSKTTLTNQSGSNDQSRDEFDFGGLPELNLKKNLGCG